MPSKQYYEGRLMESNPVLHQHLVSLMNYDDIFVDGSTGTKTDIFGLKNGAYQHISVKNASGKNTQVHLTTLSKMSQDLNIPDNVKDKLNMWLGTQDTALFQQWAMGKKLSAYERSHNRLYSDNVANWHQVENWINAVTKDSTTLPRLLLQGKNPNNPVEFMLWINKKTGNFQLVDVNNLIEWIASDCHWVTTKRKTVLKCLNPDNQAILWLQMKGNKDKVNGGYNHAPQFHIVENWPKEFVVNAGTIIFN